MVISAGADSKKDIWVLFGLAIVSVIFALSQVLFVGPYYFQSDFASTVLLGREQIQSGGLFPSDWWYPQEVQVISYNLFIIPFQMLLSDAMLARQAGVAFICVLLALVLYLFARKVFSSKIAFLLGVILLFQMWSSTWADMLFYEGSYLLTILFTLLTPLLFLSAYKDGMVLKNKKWLVVFILFITLMAFSGIRLLESTGVSVLFAIVFIFFMEYQPPFLESKKSFVRHVLASIALIVAACVVGYVGYLLFTRGGLIQFIPGVTATQYGTLQDLASNAFHIPLLVAFLFDLVGYVPSVSFFSLSGIVNLFKLAFMVGLVFVIPVQVAREYYTLTFKDRFFFLFVIAYTVINTFVLMCSSDLAEGMVNHAGATSTNCRYVLVNLAIIFMLDAGFLARHWPKDTLWKAIDITLVALLMCISLRFGSFVPLEQGGAKMNGGLSMDEIAFLEERDCTFGYATFWRAESTTILSNYRVEIEPVFVSLDSSTSVKPLLMLSSNRWFEPSYHDGSSFLLLSDDEYSLAGEEALNTQFGLAKETYAQDGYKVIVYDYNIAFQMQASGA